MYPKYFGDHHYDNGMIRCIL